jgi:peptidoglycan/LPS O-acetylase OafA/YrhL
MSETKTLSNQPVAYDAQTGAWRADPSLHGVEIGTTIPSLPSRGRQTLRFLRHFGEMVLAMLLGMAVFDVVTGAIHIPMGLEVSAASMAVAMTVPMVAWMRICKHAWLLNVEMAGAMIVPTLLLIGASRLGLLPPTSLMLLTHILMVPAMLAVMLYRWRDYTCH